MIPREILIRVKLEEYTPWWSGDYLSKTFRVNNKLDCYEDPCLTPLTEDTLKGRLRWVLRALLAGIPGYRHLDIATLDRIIGVLFGYAGTRTKQTYSSLVSLTVKYNSSYVHASRRCKDNIVNRLEYIRQNIVNQIRGKLGSYEQQFKEVDFIQELLDALGKWIMYSRIANRLDNPLLRSLQSFDQFFNGVVQNVGMRVFNIKDRRRKQQAKNHLLRVISASDVRGHLQSIAMYAMRDKCLRALALLLATPYVKLNMLGANKLEDLVSKLPSIRECGCDASFEVELRVDVLQVALRLGTRGSPLRLAEHLAALSLASLAIAAMLVGLGRGSTRGFSRFTVMLDPKSSIYVKTLDNVYNTSLDAVKEIANIVNSASEALKQGDANKLVNEIRKLIEKAQEHLKILLNHIVNQAKAEESIDSEEAKPRNVYVEAFHDVKLIDNSINRYKGSGTRVGELYNGPFVMKVITELKHPLPLHIQLAGGKLNNQALGCIVASNMQNLKPEVQDIYEALSALSTATLKTIWKLKCGIEVKSMGGTLHTQILGLPRSQKIRKKRYGYIDVDRRKSPIIVMPICGKEKCSALVGAFITIHDHIENMLNKLKHSSECYSEEPVPVLHILQNSGSILINCCTGRLSRREGQNCGLVRCKSSVLGLPIIPLQSKCPSAAYDACTCVCIDLSNCNKEDMVLHIYDAALSFLKELLS